MAKNNGIVYQRLDAPEFMQELYNELLKANMNLKAENAALKKDANTVGAVALHLAEITLWHWDAKGNRYDNAESSDNAKALAERLLDMVDPMPTTPATGQEEG